MELSIYEIGEKFLIVYCTLKIIHNQMSWPREVDVPNELLRSYTFFWSTSRVRVIILGFLHFVLIKLGFNHLLWVFV